MKKRVMLSIISFLLVAFCMTAMITTPYKYVEYVPNNGDIVETIQKEQGEEITTNNIVFQAPASRTKHIVVKLRYVPEWDTSLRLYLYEGNQEESLASYNATVPANQQYAYFTVNEENYTSLEIQLSDGNDIFGQIEFHTAEAQIKTKSIYPSKARVILAILVSVLAGVAVFFVDKRACWSERIPRFVQKRWRNAVKIIIAVCVASAVSVVIELIISLIMKVSQNSEIIFNFQRYSYINGIVMIIVLFILGKNRIKSKTEDVLVGLLVILGMTMIFATPPQHASWDIDSHYNWAVNASSLGKSYLTQADKDFIEVNSESVPKRTREENLQDIKRLNQENKYVVSLDYGELSLAHFPAGIAIAITRFFRLPFYVIYKAGEIANLLVYSLLCYFGISKLKSGKMIFAVIAMIPTSLFLATAYSYDYWVTAFSLMGMAYFIGNCQRTNEYITTKDTIIMVSAFALACIPKQVYVMLMLIPFFMPRHKIENKRKYYTICLAGFAFLFASLMLRTIRIAGSEGDLRGGIDVSPGGQIKYILTNPIEYADRLIDYVRNYLSLSMVREYTIFYGYLGFSKYGADTIILLTTAVALTDKDECDYYKYSMLVRIYGIFTYVVSAMLIVTAMYISFTPVASLEFGGAQPRYLIPLLYPMLATVGSGRITNQMNKKFYNYAVLSIMALVVLYGIYDTMLFRMI